MHLLVKTLCKWTRVSCGLMVVLLVTLVLIFQNSFSFIADYSQTGKTMNTRIISGMFFFLQEKKPIRREKTKPQARTLISLWFCGLLACPNLCCDWSQRNKHSWNISSVHGFPGRTVISKNDRSNRVRGREAWEDAIKGLGKLHHWFVIIRLHLIVWIGSKTVCYSKHGYIIVNSI